MDYRVVPIEWEVVYPVHVHPIGRLRARAGHFEAKLGDEYLGAFPTGDAGVEAVWERFLEQSAVRHEVASRTHGSRDRHAHETVGTKWGCGVVGGLGTNVPPSVGGD